MLLLIIVVIVAWTLWLIGSLVALEADKREKKRPADAGVSVLPAIPFFPLIAIALAGMIDHDAAPWGSRVIGGLHLLMAAACLISLISSLRRGRTKF